MKMKLGYPLLALTFVVNAAHAQVEAIHSVGAAGSTVAVSNFTFSDAPPWLYIDMFAPLPELTWITANLKHGSTSVAISQFSGSGDKLWYAPSVEAWDAAKTAGDWTFETTFNSIELICIYGGCVGAGFYSSVGPVASFSVDVPEPATVALFGLGIAGVGLLRRWPR